jgi:hypothetical protein
MAPPAELQHENFKSYEEKWDKIVMKMLREQVYKDSEVGAEYAKGLHFYFIAAMKFAKELEHEFQVGQHLDSEETNENQKGKNKQKYEVSTKRANAHPTGIPSFGTMKQGEVDGAKNKQQQENHWEQQTISSSSKTLPPLVNVPQPISVPKEILTKKQYIVPTKIFGTDNSEINKSRTAIHESEKENAIVSTTTNESSNEYKRFSLQLDPSKMLKFVANSVTSTPTEDETSDATTKFVSETSNKKSENLFVAPQKVHAEVMPLPEPIKFPQEALEDIPPRPQKPIVKEIPEVIKPSIPITQPPKIEPKLEPPRRIHPLGATAICNDGTYSYSQNRRGTCSHHGGVQQWL